MIRKLPMWIEQEGGLRFECTSCGECCRGEGSYVWVDTAEIERLARHLELTVEAFGRRYLRRAGDELALTERPGGDCTFFEEGRGCTVYDARPEQCRSFPFWKENLRSHKAWVETGRSCPGISDAGPEARIYRTAEILAIARGSGGTDRGPDAPVGIDPSARADAS